MSVVKALQLSDDPKFVGLRETLDDYLQKVQHHSDEETRATKLADGMHRSSFAQMSRLKKLHVECEVELEGIPENESPESPLGGWCRCIRFVGSDPSILGSKRKRLQEDESTHHRTARTAKRNVARFQSLGDQYRQHIFSYCAGHRSKVSFSSSECFTNTESCMNYCSS